MSFAPQLKLAAELEPLSPPINTALGDGYFLARQYDQAIDQYNSTLRKFPNYAGAERNLAAVYVQVGRYDEAVRLLHEVSDNKGDLAYAYAVQGKKKEARKLIPALSDPTEIAVVYAALGERDRAFDWLDKAFQNRSFLLFQLAVDPALDFFEIRLAVPNSASPHKLSERESLARREGFGHLDSEHPRRSGQLKIRWAIVPGSRPIGRRQCARHPDNRATRTA